MSINDHLLIEKYFQGVLTPEEKVLYEQKLTGDPVFRKEAEVHKQALQLIHEEGHRMLKERLGEKGKGIDLKQRWRMWLGLILLLLAVLFIIKFRGILSFSQPEVKEEILQPKGTPQIHSSNPITVNTVKNEDNDQADLQPYLTETGTAAPNATKQNTDELFAAYYTPFEDKGLQSGLRGQDSPGPSDRFVEAYLTGNYAIALSLFENMDSYDRQNDNMIFLKALSLVGTGEYSRAIPMLEQIIERDQARYVDAAQWYLVLVYLKTGSTDKAKARLILLNQNPSAPYFQNAFTLLNKL